MRLTVAARTQIRVMNELREGLSQQLQSPPATFGTSRSRDGDGVSAVGGGGGVHKSPSQLLRSALAAGDDDALAAALIYARQHPAPGEGSVTRALLDEAETSLEARLKAATLRQQPPRGDGPSAPVRERSAATDDESASPGSETGPEPSAAADTVRASARPGAAAQRSC